jgi:hypothetical protein
VSDIQVNLVSGGDLLPDAIATANVLEDIARQEKRIAGVAKMLGVEHKKVAAAIKEADRNAKSLADRQAKAAAAAKKRAQQASAQEAAATKQRGEAQMKFLRGAGVAVALIAAAAVAAGAVAYAIGKAAAEAGKAQQSAKGLMGILTGGRGTEALALVDGMAKKLGVRFEVARDQFVKFRQAGLDNKQSAALMKLSADLNAIDPSGAAAEEAISKVLDKKGGSGTEALMALLAKQAGVAGDGALAAAKSVSTWSGAMARIDNTKTEVLQKIWERIGPSVDKAGTRVANFIEGFANSRKGAAVIEWIGKAFDGISRAIELAEPIVSAFIDGLSEVLGELAPVFEEVGAAVSELFGSNTSNAMSLVTAAARTFGMALGFVASGVGIVVGAIAGLVAISAVIQAKIYDMIGAVGKLGIEFAAAGVAVVDGFIQGIKSRFSAAVNMVSNLASQVSGKFKSALGIASPSKVFAEYGVNTGEGYEKGVDKSMPDGSEMAAKMLPSAPSRASGSAPSGGGGGGGLVVNIAAINVVGGGTADENAKSIRAELTNYLSASLLSKGIRV